MMTTAMQTNKIVQDYLITNDTIVVIFDWGPPVSIRNDNDRFAHIEDLLENGRLEEVPEEVDKALAIRKHTKGKFTVINGTIHIGDEKLPKALSDKLIEFVDNRLETTPLERFWENLKENPTESARQDLFSFLEANQVPLTADGCFIAYKRVTENGDGGFVDIRTESIDNTPGAIVSMPREQVDPDRRNTCSAGLHVAAWSYLDCYAPGEVTLEVKINPRDVVAVPPDYNNAKMRTCRYLVLRQTDREYDKSIYEEAVVDLTPLTSTHQAKSEPVEEDEYEEDEYGEWDEWLDEYDEHPDDLYPW